MITMHTCLAACLRHRLVSVLLALAWGLTLVTPAPAQESFLVVESSTQARSDAPETPDSAQIRQGSSVIRPLPAQFRAPAVAGLPLWASARAIDPAAVELMNDAGDLIEVELPRGSDTVVALLRRVEIVAADATLVLQSLDGSIAPLNLSLSVWSGHVAGHPDSEVFLGISPTQAQGWITLGDHTHLIATRPTPAGPLTLAYDQDELDVAGAIKPPSCQGEVLPPGIVPPPPTGEAGYAPRSACKSFAVAIETDNEFELIAGGPQDAADYAVILVAAANVIYTREAGMGFEVRFLRLWDGPDPWTGIDTDEQLQQFRTYWVANEQSVVRASAHLFSGRDLGGGRAYLRAACSDDWGYALSADIEGAFPFPIEDNSPDNWDLIVVAHEWGHQFGSGHTHNSCEYSPIIDGCGLSTTNPPCENGTKDCSVAVARNGTIMSYCHTCAGGVRNLKATLGPRVAERIAEFASTASCAIVRNPPSVTAILASPSVDACPGTPIRLEVVASGDSLRYQWFRNGLRVERADDRFFVVTSPVPSDEWDVVVYSPCGVISTQGTSLTARFTGKPPVITDEPDSQNVCPRSIVTFAVVATGDGQLTYQWTRNGANLADGFIGGVRFAGSASSQLSVYGVTAFNTGDLYRCVVSSTCGTITSMAATLEVQGGQPDPVLLPSGDQIAGVDGTVSSSIFFDPDGPEGPVPQKLVVGGRFKVAGPFAADNIALFDPETERWEPLGAGVTVTPEELVGGRIPSVEALAALPNGRGGFDLIAGGDFSLAGGLPAKSVARWHDDDEDGSFEWEPLPGLGVDVVANPGNPQRRPTVKALLAVDDDLVVGGDFDNAGGVSASRLARLSGGSWEAFGGGMDDVVRALELLPTGEIVAGGDFITPARYVAQWSGGAWSSLGSSVNDPVLCLKVRANDELIVGGDFTFAAGLPVNFIARWSGGAWSAVGTGFNSSVIAIDELPGGDLIAAGDFSRTFDDQGGEIAINRIARWNELDATWSPVGPQGTDGLADRVSTLATLGPDAGPSSFPASSFVAGGDFDLAGLVPVARIAAFGFDSPNVWSAVGSGVIGRVSALEQIPVGDLIAGHTVNYKDRPKARRIAKWDGLTWSALQADDDATKIFGVDRVVNAFLERGNDLFVGGEFLNEVKPLPSNPVVLNRIGQWNTATGVWTPLGPGFTGAVNALAELSSGDIVAGGAFLRTFLQPGQPQITLNRIGLWNGSTWSPFGSGMSGAVNALLVRNGELIAGGSFINAGGVQVNRIARWNGTTWLPIGAGFNSSVKALVEYEGDLVAAGDFTASGTVMLNRIARWDGTAWTPLGDGIAVEAPGFVNALAVSPYNGDLVAAGNFTDAGGVTVAGVARWDGAQWLEPSVGVTGVDGEVKALATLEPAGELVVGGFFSKVRTDADELISPFVSRYGYRGPPSVLVHPVGRTVPRGQTLTLTAMPGNGLSNVSVQWRRNGIDLVNIPGKIAGAAGPLTQPPTSPTAGTVATLTVSDFSENDVGAYRAIFSSNCGERATNPAFVDLLCVTPSIIRQPTSVLACLKDAATLSIVVESYPAPSFQWRKNGVPIAGAVAASLTFPFISEADVGSYTCVVSNACGSVTSAPASLDFTSQPAITSQPSLQRICLGGSATFSVAAAGTPPLRFQWRKNGVNIPGARAASFSIAAADFPDVASYDCAVSNDCGTTLSNKARLEIGTGPRIAPLPSSTPACTGAPLVLAVSVTDTVGVVTYQWRKNGVNIVDAVGPSFSVTQPTAADDGAYDCIVTDNCGVAVSSATQVAVVNGVPSDITDQPDDVVACSDQPVTFSLVASATPSFQWRKDGVAIPGATSSAYTIPAVASGDVGSYDCVLVGPCGVVVSDAATLQLSAPPLIEFSPVSQLACAGDPITFAISASATPPPTFQWRKNGIVIDGATGSSFTIASILPADQGAFDCVVTSGCTSVTSKAATLAIGSPNDLVSDALPLIDGLPLFGDTSCATIDSVEPACPANLPVSAPGLWYRLQGTGNSVNVSLCGSLFNTRLGVFCGSPDALSCIASDNDSCGLASSVTFCTTPGADYFILVHGDVGEVGRFTIVASDSQLPCNTPLVCAPVGACCVGITCTQLTEAACNAQGGIFLGEGVSCDDLGFDAGYAASGPFPVSIPDRRAASASISVPPGSGQVTDLAVRLGLRHSYVGDLIVTLSRADTSVVLVARSQSAAEVNGELVFTDLADRKFSDAANAGFAVPSGNYRPASPLAAFAGQPLDGLWTIEVRDQADFDVGEITSFAIQTTAATPSCTSTCPPPVVVTQPEPQAVCIGLPVTFAVVATGTPPLTYQWRKDGVNVSGATSASYTIPAVTPANVASYDCLVSNTCGTTTSAPAILTTRTPPFIPNPPSITPPEPCIGASTTISVFVAGTRPLTYQWRRNGVNLADGGGISGVTSDTLSFTSVTPANAGIYQCVVANACGTEISQPATLIVQTPPAILTQPSPRTVCAGEPTSMSISVDGIPVPVLQWRRNGVNLADGGGISGVTSDTLSFTSVTPADAGLYDCVVTTPCGTVTSAVAAIVVNVSPVITAQPASHVKCASQAVTFMVDATGTPAPTFQWRKDGAVIVGANARSFTIASIDPVDAGEYDCVVSNICAEVVSNAATLTVRSAPEFAAAPVSRAVCVRDTTTFSVAAAGSAPLAFQWRRNGEPLVGATLASYTITSVEPADAGDYDCVVTNACGTSTSPVAILTVRSAPEIDAAPVSRAVCVRATTTFSVAAAGSAPLAFQWRRNGEPLVGATLASYTITSVEPADAGDYDCVVTNACGSSTSPPATLQVNDIGFGNDRISEALPLTPGFALVGDTTCASIDLNAPVCSGQVVTAPGLWYKVAGQGSAVVVSLCGSSFDTRLGVFCAAGAALTCIAGNDDACGNASSVAFCAQAGADYYVLVHGFQAAKGPFTIILTDTQEACSAPIACSPVGACCLPGNDCQQRSASDCQVAGGTFLGEGTPCQSVAHPDRFVSVGPFPVDIPDPGSASASIAVPVGAGAIERLAVRVGLDHASVGDLVVTLSRQATSVVLVARSADEADLVGEYVFADAAPAAFATAAAGVPFVMPSVYTPANPLAAFEGQPFDGQWTLQVVDAAAGHVGRITSFALLNTAFTPACDLCIADFNQDGGIDGADIEAFFAAWEQSDPRADVNQDGGIDGADIEPFFVLWESGSC